MWKTKNCFCMAQRISLWIEAGMLSMLLHRWPLMTYFDLQYVVFWRSKYIIIEHLQKYRFRKKDYHDRTWIDKYYNFDIEINSCATQKTEVTGTWESRRKLWSLISCYSSISHDIRCHLMPTLIIRPKAQGLGFPESTPKPWAHQSPAWGLGFSGLGWAGLGQVAGSKPDPNITNLK